MKYVYLSHADPEYLDELFARFQKDPDSVDESWRYFFEGLEIGDTENGSSQPATPIANGNGHAISSVPTKTNGQAAPATPVLPPGFNLSAEAKVAELITAYRERGRLLASLDPLSAPPSTHPLLELSNFKLGPEDLDKNFTAGKLIGMGPSSLREIIKRLKEVYCASIGVEYTHIQDPVAREWLQNQMESSRNREKLAPEVQKKILKRLTDSWAFENFIHTRYVAQKRFSIEGSESLIPCLDRVIEVGAELGVNNIVMGMAHRGRLNVLRNIYGKNAEHIFTEFEQAYDADSSTGEGDVKYHMGFSADVVTSKGKNVHLSLAHNPSHLEYVNPVVEGIARSKQRGLGDKERTQVLPILIHGDAAFAGQGVVYETLNMSQLDGYRTGGTIHVVIDNQVGFTATPEQTRSTSYSTDMAKMLEVPIFHVNGDDPEALYFVARLSTEYRQKFKKDVFIDLICYRKYGHNEGDEPSFTQPLQYKKIKNHPTPRERYATKLAQAGVADDGFAKSLVDEVIKELTEAQKKTREEKPKPFSSSYTERWKDLRPAGEADVYKEFETKVSKEKLIELGKKLVEIPTGFHLHPKLKRFFDARRKALEAGTGIDWGNGEALAYASLLAEGNSIRLSGQDVERGTFTHRHAVLHDNETGELLVPHNHLTQDQGELIIYNSLLSEAGVLGFEYGWSLADPKVLVIWEAQFGDFANSAQVIIDQFISSSESKWQRASGLVLQLPHGYEGQGPEHSSARLERFLQLCSKNNMSVCNFTTPAQLFHALRRQLKRDFRKPLVIMTPKSLLRHPMAVSKLEDFSDAVFEEFLDDPNFTDDAAQKAEKVLLCSGKVYYDLLAEREKLKRDKIAILRLEQFYPFPADKMKAILSRYANVKEFYWVQEEAKNMGAWLYVFSKWHGGLGIFGSLVGDRPIRYIGRSSGSAPAAGSSKIHAKQQKRLIEEALS